MQHCGGIPGSIPEEEPVLYGDSMSLPLAEDVLLSSQGSDFCPLPADFAELTGLLRAEMRELELRFSRQLAALATQVRLETEQRLADVTELRQASKTLRQPLLGECQRYYIGSPNFVKPPEARSRQPQQLASACRSAEDLAAALATISRETEELPVPPVPPARQALGSAEQEMFESMQETIDELWRKVNEKPMGKERSSSSDVVPLRSGKPDPELSPLGSTAATEGALELTPRLLLEQQPLSAFQGAPPVVVPLLQVNGSCIGGLEAAARGER